MPIFPDRYWNIVRSFTVFFFIFLLPTQLGLHLWPAWTNIDGLRVDYLSPVISLVNIVAIVLILLFWKTRSLSWPIYIPLLVIFLVCANTLLSLLPLQSLYRWVSVFLIVFAIRNLLKNGVYSREIFLGMALGTCVQLILVLLQFFFQSSLQGIWYWLGERAVYPWMPDIAQLSLYGRQFMRPYGTFSHPNAMGGFFLVIHFLLQNGRLDIPREKTRMQNRLLSSLKYIAIIASALLVLMSFSRTAIALFILLHIILVLRDPTYRWCRFCQIVRPIMLLAVGAVFLQGQGDIFTSEKRWYLIQRAFEVFSLHLISGTGWGASVVTTAGNYFQNIPLYQPVHNIYLLWAVETGIIGVFVAVYFIGRYRSILWHGLSASAPLIAILLTGLNDHYWLTQPQNIALCVFITLWLLYQPNAQIDGKMTSAESSRTDV